LPLVRQLKPLLDSERVRKLIKACPHKNFPNEKFLFANSDFIIFYKRKPELNIERIYKTANPPLAKTRGKKNNFI